MRLVAPLFSVLILCSLLATGCTKSTSVTEVDTVRDTLNQYDTIRAGPVLVRFIAFLSSGGQSITLKMSTSSTAAPFTSAPAQSTRSFVPMRSDTSVMLYAYYIVNSALTIDSFPVPSGNPQEFITYALFQSQGGDRLAPAVGSIDSAMAIPAPQGYAYVRLINGLPDYPNPFPRVELYLDSLNSKPLFVEPTTHVPTYVGFQEIGNYVLVPAGQHTLIVAGESSTSPDYTASLNLFSQGYYTCRLTGRKGDQTDRLTVDAE